jgi:hypothetical protein
MFNLLKPFLSILISFSLVLVALFEIISINIENYIYASNKYFVKDPLLVNNPGNSLQGPIIEGDFTLLTNIFSRSTSLLYYISDNLFENSNALYLNILVLILISLFLYQVPSKIFGLSLIFLIILTSIQNDFFSGFPHMIINILNFGQKYRLDGLRFFVWLFLLIQITQFQKGLRFIRFIPNLFLSILLFILCMVVLLKTYSIELSQLSFGSQLLNCDGLPDKTSFGFREFILSAGGTDCIYHQE